MDPFLWSQVGEMSENRREHFTRNRSVFGNQFGDDLMQVGHTQ